MSSEPFVVEGLQALRLGRLTTHDAGVEVRWDLPFGPAWTSRQCVALWVVLCVPCLGIAAGFWSNGVRWVLPFAGIETLGVALALRWFHVRCSRPESIALRADGLVVERWQGWQRRRDELPMPWVRVEARADGRAPVELKVRDRAVRVGGHLGPAQRVDLARDLRIALRCLA
jgi:uncharacterized membrane protein